MVNLGAFCEVYGSTIRNRVLEFILENHNLDFAVSDMSKELLISKPKAYEVIKEFEKKRYVKKSRLVGKTQLYILNKKNIIVKMLLKNFKECLKAIIEENSNSMNKNTIKEKEQIEV